MFFLELLFSLLLLLLSVFFLLYRFFPILLLSNISLFLKKKSYYPFIFIYYTRLFTSPHFSLFLNLLHLLMLSFSLLYRPPTVSCSHLVLSTIMLRLISSLLFSFIITPTAVFSHLHSPVSLLPYVDYFSSLSSTFTSKILPSTFPLNLFPFFYCLLSSPPTT